MKKLLLFILLFISIVSFSGSKEVFAQGSGTKVVKAIEVKGNNTIGIATILSKIKTRVGQEYLQSVVSDDLKRLYNTGYFSDVKVDRKDHEGGLKVIIFLEEKPIVEEVTFSKTKYIKGKSLKRKIKTQAGKFLDKKSLKDDIDTIKELYVQKGFIHVEVEEELFVDEVTNKVSIHFIVREGYRVRIKKINIFGSESYKKRKIRRIIKTRRKTLFTGGYLKEEMLKEDMGRIVSFYEQNGFIDARAEYAVEYLYKGRIEINITIAEGKRYSVGNVVVLGNRILSDKELFSVMDYIEEGNVFSREKLSVDLSGIRALYFDRGYIFANVEESTSLDTKTGKVEVKINIVEGGLAYIEKIKVQGNARTRDIVIRRELRMFPGDRFDGTKLRRSKERLNNLGYFEEVDFDIEDTDAYDRKNLVVQVKEAKTGTFSFGGGFSTVDQVVGFVEVEQRNFDFANWPTFTGGGQQLKVRAETGSTKNNLLLSFTEPWIFDYPVSGGFDLYRRVRDREENTGYAYDEERVGGDIRFGKQFTEYVSGSVTYKREEVTIENFEAGVSPDLFDEAGTNTTSMIGFTLSRDTRDSVFSPTKGLMLSGGFDVAGSILGGDKDFFRLQAMSSYYIPLKFRSVLELRVQGGYINAFDDSSKVPIFERFFAGGARTVRGYDERKVGPLDGATNDPIGGESMLIANIEYTIPIIDFIKLAAFFDSGNVWSTVEDFGSGGFKSGMGLGLRVKTPVGPINLDYGYPLNNEPGEDGKSGKFYFSVSRGF